MADNLQSPFLIPSPLLSADSLPLLGTLGNTRVERNERDGEKRGGSERGCWTIELGGRAPGGLYRRAALCLFALFCVLFAETCAHPPPPPPQPAVVAPEPNPEANVDWNIFPDPLTGRVEVYQDGAYVGSVTGEETEDPPAPRRRESAGTETE